MQQQKPQKIEKHKPNKSITEKYIHKYVNLRPKRKQYQEIEPIAL